MILQGMALQLVDSELATTRQFWRKQWGLSDEVCNDPRPMKEILGEWPDWRMAYRATEAE